MTGWAWFWMSLMMLAFWSVVGFAIYALLHGSRSETHHDTPNDVLARRFARGEISREEFEESRKLIAS